MVAGVCSGHIRAHGGATRTQYDQLISALNPSGSPDHESNFNLRGAFKECTLSLGPLSGESDYVHSFNRTLRSYGRGKRPCCIGSQRDLADGSPLRFTDSIGHKFSPPLGRSDFDAWRKAELIAEDLIAPAKQGHVFGLTGRGLEAANKLVGWRGFRKAAVG